MDTELRQQPAPDEGADDSDDEVADNAEPGALYDLTGKPSGNEADQQDDEEAFARHVHVRRFPDRLIGGPILSQGSRASWQKPAAIACESPTVLGLCQDGS